MCVCPPLVLSQIISGACVGAASTPWSEDGGGELPVPSGAAGSHLNLKDVELLFKSFVFET